MAATPHKDGMQVRIRVKKTDNRAFNNNDYHFIPPSVVDAVDDLFSSYSQLGSCGNFEENDDAQRSTMSYNGSRYLNNNSSIVQSTCDTYNASQVEESKSFDESSSEYDHQYERPKEIQHIARIWSDAKHDLDSKAEYIRWQEEQRTEASMEIKKLQRQLREATTEIDNLETTNRNLLRQLEESEAVQAQHSVSILQEENLRLRKQLKQKRDEQVEADQHKVLLSAPLEDLAKANTALRCDKARLIELLKRSTNNPKILSLLEVLDSTEGASYLGDPKADNSSELKNNSNKYHFTGFGGGDVERDGWHCCDCEVGGSHSISLPRPSTPPAKCELHRRDCHQRNGRGKSSTAQARSQKRTERVMDHQLDKLHWIPTNLTRIIQKYCGAQQPYVTDDQVASMTKAIWKLMLSRERSVHLNAKRHTKKTVAELQRKLSQVVPYDSHVLHVKAKRLEQELYNERCARLFSKDSNRRFI